MPSTIRNLDFRTTPPISLGATALRRLHCTNINRVTGCRRPDKSADRPCRAADPRARRSALQCAHFPLALYMHVIGHHRKFQIGGLRQDPGAQHVVGTRGRRGTMCHVFHELLQLLIVEVNRDQPDARNTRIASTATPAAWRKRVAITTDRPHPARTRTIRPTFRRGVPFRILKAGDLHFGQLQSAVAVWTNVLDARPSEEQHAAPRSGFDRHAQTPQAHPAAITLVPDAQVKQTAAGQEPKTRQQGVGRS